MQGSPDGPEWAVCCQPDACAGMVCKGASGWVAGPVKQVRGCVCQANEESSELVTCLVCVNLARIEFGPGRQVVTPVESNAHGPHRRLALKLFSQRWDSGRIRENCCRISRDSVLGNWGTDDKIVDNEIASHECLVTMVGGCFWMFCVIYF